MDFHLQHLPFVDLHQVVPTSHEGRDVGHPSIDSLLAGELGHTPELERSRHGYLISLSKPH